MDAEVADGSGAGFAKCVGELQEMAEGQKLMAVAVGSTGQLRGDNGELTTATNLPEWLGLPVVATLREQFDCPVLVTNDVELGGLGETRAQCCDRPCRSW